MDTLLNIIDIILILICLIQIIIYERADNFDKFIDFWSYSKKTKAGFELDGVSPGYIYKEVSKDMVYMLAMIIIAWVAPIAKLGLIIPITLMFIKFPILKYLRWVQISNKGNINYVSENAKTFYKVDNVLCIISVSVFTIFEIIHRMI